MKLGIGIPVVNRMIDKDFFLSFAALEKPECIIYAPTQDVYGFAEDIAKVRNGLVHQALMDDCSHLIMMDTDQIYPADTIMKMISHDADVVGALVHRRYPPFAPILYRGELHKYKNVSYEETYSGGLVEVDATGTGCILFNMEVFKAIEPPWFELIPGKDGRPVGEDIRFCTKLRSAGYRIYVDTSVRADHLTTFRVNKNTYDLFRAIHRPTKPGSKKETAQ